MFSRPKVTDEYTQREMQEFVVNQLVRIRQTIDELDKKLDVLLEKTAELVKENKR